VIVFIEGCVMSHLVMFVDGCRDDRQYVVNLGNAGFFQVIQSTLDYTSPRSVPFDTQTIPTYFACSLIVQSSNTTSQLLTNTRLASVFEGGKLLEMTHSGSIGTSPLYVHLKNATMCWWTAVDRLRQCCTAPGGLSWC
jgi:hypothetical protein